METNKNHIRQSTEYAEAVALKLYCFICNYSFDDLISKRRLENLCAFPDFIISNNSFLEVTRSLDEICGKQNSDIAEVFDSFNKQLAADIVNARNKEFEAKGFPHNVDFIKANNYVVSSIPLLSRFEIIALILIKAVEKNCEIKSKKLQKGINVDLFIFGFHPLGPIDLENLSNMLLHVDFDRHIRKVYTPVVDDRELIIFEFDVKKKNCSIHKINCLIDWNKIEDKIIELGWMKGQKYEK